MKFLPALLVSLSLSFCALAQPAFKPDSVAGKSFYFDGSSNYVDTRFTGHLGRYSVECWVKSPHAPTYNQGKGPVHYESNFQINWDHVSSGAIHALVMRDSLGTWYGCDFGNMDANTWYHLAGTYDGDTMKTYRNGELIAINAAPVGPAYRETASLKIGKHAVLSNPQYEFFNGTVDEVRIWDRAISKEQIRLNMHHSLKGTEPGLKLYYQFNDPYRSTADTITREAISGHNGLLINRPARVKATMPFGRGTSVLTPVKLPGTYTCPNLSVQLNQVQGPGNLMLTYLRDSIGGSYPDTTTGRLLQAPYWLVHSFDSLQATFGSSTFSPTPKDVTWFGTAPQPTFKLLTRNIGSDKDWAIADSATSFSLATNLINYSKLPNGQLMIGKIQQIHNLTSLAKTGPNTMQVAYDAGNDRFLLTFPGGHESHIAAFDLMGRQVALNVQAINDEVFSVGGQNLPSGMYLFRAESNKGCFAGRMVK